MGQRWLDGYSAHVEIYLEVGGERFDIAQIGDGSFILRDAGQIPIGTRGRLVIKIDGHEEEEQIFLFEGTVSGKETVEFEPSRIRCR